MPTKLNPRDAKTIKRLRELADGVVQAAGRKRDPYVDVPTRSLSNVRYNKTRRFIEMGNNTNRRHLFNLSERVLKLPIQVPSPFGRGLG